MGRINLVITNFPQKGDEVLSHSTLLRSEATKNDNFEVFAWHSSEKALFDSEHLKTSEV